MVTKTVTIREKVPEVLMLPCDLGKRPPLVNVGVMYDRMITAEKNLDICATKPGKVRRWNNG